MAKNRRTKDENETVTVDYRKPVPDWVRAAIDEYMGNDIEDAKHAGALGFMARALVMATMPYKDPKTDAFTRKNGEFRLRILAGYEGGIPYGIYPRLLLSWVTTEAVRCQSPVIELGDSLRGFLREVMELRSSSGGSRGTSTRVSEQMKRLFGALITAQYTGDLGNGRKGFKLRNVMIADDLDIDGEDWALDGDNAQGSALWRPQDQHEAGTWQSTVRLSQNFFQECIDRPIPIDLRAYKSLRGSPLAMDVYTWLTYRMSYTERRTRPIPWASLMLQFGSNFQSDQAVRDFKKAFLKALKAVAVVYPQAQVDVKDNGLVLIPSPTHIQPMGQPRQKELF
ncbi:replication protein RepA [Thiolapillus sp.]|nr:replication protein RepA [Thiolapillus sp.]